MPFIPPGGGGGGSSFPFIPYTMVFTVQLPNLPEWAIPMIKVIPRCYIDDGYPVQDVTFNLQCQHIWTVSPNQDSLGNSLNPTVILQIMIFASATITQAIATYIDVDLVFMNERAYNEINTNKE